MTDLAVVAMDPRFGGGSRAQTEAFWRAALELGREPELHCFAHPTLAGRPAGRTLPADGVRVPSRHVDALNHLAAGERIAPRLRRARSVWVVSPTAPYGWPAARSGRPYACWLGTGLREEQAARLPGLPRSRALAARASAPVLRRLERRVLRGAAALYATSPSSRAELARAGGLDERRIGLLPIPVDVERLRPAPEPPAGPPLLLFVGRADDPRKNARLLLDALPLLRRRVPDARLRLVGTPPPGPLPQGAEAAGEAADLRPHLHAASLLLVPSLQEGFGVVAAEALAAGVPVLATPCGGPEHLLRASGGGAVLAGFSAEELAEAAAALLEDGGRLAAMGRAGRDYVVREHSPARLRELLAQAFERLG